MREQEEYLVCSKHNKTEILNEKFAKNVYICVNRYCANSFQLACVKCRSEFHKDHVIKFLTLESFRTLINLLVGEEPKKSSQEGYDYYKRLKLIREFRKRMQTIQAELSQSIDDVISSCLQIDSEYTEYKKQLEVNQKYIGNFSTRSSIEQALSRYKGIGRLIDYNFKKGTLQFQSPKLKELEDKVRKSLDKSGKQMEQMKEHTMKIIEVILHQPQSDDEVEINMIRKKFKMYMEAEADNAGLKAQYKDIIDELVEDLNKKSNELDTWFEKAEVLDPGIRQHYKDSIFVKVYEIAEENIEIHRENQAMAKELQDMRYQLDDLRGKVSRMNDRMNEIKRALLEEDEKFRVLKTQYEKITGKEYIVPKCSINLEFWRLEALKMSGMAQQKVQILKSKMQRMDSKDTKREKQKDTNTRVNTTETLKVQQQPPKESTSTLSQSRMIAEQRREQVIISLLSIIAKQEKTNQQWADICHKKNQTIQSLNSKLKALIDYSRKMVLSQ